LYQPPVYLFIIEFLFAHEAFLAVIDNQNNEYAVNNRPVFLQAFAKDHNASENFRQQFKKKCGYYRSGKRIGSAEEKEQLHFSGLRPAERFGADDAVSHPE
jgi:hypothetical protein